MADVPDRKEDRATTVGRDCNIPRRHRRFGVSLPPSLKWRTSIAGVRWIPRPQTFDAWIAYRDYRFLWVGNFFANTAHWLQLLTLGWLVRDLTKGTEESALLVVGIGGVSTLPGVIIGPLGGVLGDRVDRRKLIMSLQAVMAVLAFGFAWIVAFEVVEVWHVFAYAIVSGAFLSVTQPMRQALIANTVPKHMLGNAYATNVLTIPGTRAIGPFVGGILVIAFGFFWNFAIESLLYIGMILAFLPMRTPFGETRRTRTGSGTAGFFQDLAEGFRYVWSGNRVLFLLITLTIVPNVVLQPVMFLLPLFTEEILQRGADVGGFMLAINGFGGFLMALTIASFGFFIKRGMVCLITAAASSVLALLLIQAAWLPLALVVIAIFAASQTAFRTTNGTLTQTLAPDELRGRITSLQRLGQGFVVGSSLLVGWFAGVTSVRLALAAMGIVGLAIAVAYFVLSGRLRDQE